MENKELKNQLRVSSFFVSNHNKDNVSKKYETLEDYNADQISEDSQENNGTENKKE